MDKKLPIYRLVINEDQESGVEYVALVDRPAIERNWVAFNEDFAGKEFKFAVADEEKHIISGPLMVANLPIYRKDKFGEYYAVFEPDTIMQITQKYFKNKFTSNVNLMHDPSLTTEGVFMFESFIIDRKRGINPPEGFHGLTDGSWFGSYKVENEAVWSEIKAGTFKGFSVEGMFDQVLVDEMPTDDIELIISAIEGMK